METKIKVYGKSQMWTALGIVDAYTKINPNATVDELNEVFPRKLFTNSYPNNRLWDTVENIEAAALATDMPSDDKHLEYIKSHDLYITLADGTKVSYQYIMWTKDNFPVIVEEGKKYGIEVAEFEQAEKGFGKRGSYHLENVNGFVSPLASSTESCDKDKKCKCCKCCKWFWIILLIILILLLLFFLMRGCNKDKEAQTADAENAELVADSTAEQVADSVDAIAADSAEAVSGATAAAQDESASTFDKNRQPSQFSKGAAGLSASSKAELDELVEQLNQNPSVKLKVIGHASADGAAEKNQQLSEARAKAAVNYLISKGIAADRLSAEGKGSSELKDAANPNSAVNCRVEYQVVE